MKACAKCGKAAEFGDQVCPACGSSLKDQNGERKDQAVPPPAEPPARPSRSSRRPIIALAGAFVVGGIVALILISMDPSAASRRVEAADEHAATTARAATPSVAPRQIKPEEQTAQWIERHQSGWARSTVFELVADRDALVWNKRVRPVLTIRCFPKVTEVFVVTHSAASFERNSGEHTVQVKLDDNPEMTENWEDSADHEALFAPNGAAMARQLAEAHSLSFRFTPFNASPALVHFSVNGPDSVLQSARAKCVGTGNRVK
jgi:Type VI secretion system VasI, EvfG, VC_A0118